MCYILYSLRKNKYYVGYTCDSIEERLRKHNTNNSTYTGGVCDWVVKHIEKYTNKRDAIIREKEIKSWKSRIRIEKLIKENKG